jgi:dolichol-phosphate mannosyltransferase
MLPLIKDGDLVTASPYHPDGSVLHVPPWRLFLSKSLSRLYSVVLSDRTYTYTSCCRVYRKSKFADVELSNGGFLGVAETLIECKRRGGQVIEYPATLESRLLGESKMKIARTVLSHLGLLWSLGMDRMHGNLLRGSTEGPPAPRLVVEDRTTSLGNAGNASNPSNPRSMADSPPVEPSGESPAAKLRV